MKQLYKEFQVGAHSLEIVLLQFAPNVWELCWSIDNSYSAPINELTTEEKEFVKKTLSNLVEKFSTKVCLFVELFSDDGEQDKRRHIHSKWGFSPLGNGDYMFLGNEEQVALAIAKKLAMQV